MAKRSLLVWLARALAAYSVLVYAVGLLVIALPTALERGWERVFPTDSGGRSWPSPSP